MLRACGGSATVERMDFLDSLPGGFKRLAATIAGALVISLNKKLGLELDTTAQGLIAGMVVAYVGQSAAKEVAMAKVDAAAAVKTTSDAAKVLGQ